MGKEGDLGRKKNKGKATEAKSLSAIAFTSVMSKQVRGSQPSLGGGAGGESVISIIDSVS